VSTVLQVLTMLILHNGHCAVDTKLLLVHEYHQLAQRLISVKSEDIGWKSKNNPPRWTKKWCPIFSRNMFHLNKSLFWPLSWSMIWNKTKYQFAWTQVVAETDVELQLDHKKELKLTQLIYMTEFCRYWHQFPLLCFMFLQCSPVIWQEKATPTFRVVFR